MGIIKSTYRFIPVNENDEYFSPKWKNDVSMDKPFENALSGTIKYTLTANTAIFVKDSDGNFCNYDGHYFIPGTSVKGCIRSVLEILSFGHLGENRVKNNDERYEFRDIADQTGYMQKMKPVYCGWLNEDGTRITNWGKPCQIRYSELRNKIGNIDKLDCFEKYRRLTQLEYTFTNPQKLPNAGQYDQRLFCKFGGTNKGTLFFSGAIETKESDFVLLDKDIKHGEIEVPSDVLRNFKKIYPGWTAIPTNKAKGGRPVFFTIKGNRAVSIGLSYLHKYLVKNNIRNAVPTGLQGRKGFDLADVMFGNADDYRGRIQFGPAKGDMTTCNLLMKDNESLLAVLGSPRASYYPTYLQDRKTWDSENPIISGIKRYPIKPTYDVSALELKGKDLQIVRAKFGDDFASIFQFLDAPIPEKEDRSNGTYNFETVANLKPLKEGAVFNGYIHFFNLKEEELGALLSALTFHGRENKCKHSLGMAKSAGYGSTSISLNELIVNGEDKLSSKQKFLDAFKSLMTTEVDPNWVNTPRLKELFAMAEGFSEKSMTYDFKSMFLKEFAKAKQQYMRRFKDGSYGNDFLSYTETLQKYNLRSGSVGRTEKPEPQKSTTETARAKVTVLGSKKQAVLLEGKNANQSKPLEVDKVKLKIGDLIEVKVIRKGGNVEKFIFIKKL